MAGIRRISSRKSDYPLAEAVSEERRLRALLQELRLVIVHRALVAWDRSTEMFGEEIVAFNGFEEALRNIGQ